MSKPIDEGLASALIRTVGRAIRSPSVRQSVRTAALGSGAVAAWRHTQGGNPNPSPRQRTQASGDPDFSSIARAGNVGNIPQRTNNPGNILYGRTARNLGATGSYRSSNGNTYASFDSPEAGFRAMHRLMSGSGYRNLPGGQALNRWVTGDANTETPDYYKQVFRQHGIDLNRPYSEQDPVRWARAKAQAEGFYARNQVRESTLPRLSKNDIIDRTVSSYAVVSENFEPFTPQEMFVEAVSSLNESHSILLLKLFNDLAEENQEVMLEMVQSEEGVRELLDFAIDKYMAQKN
jgi:hypothetical protein